MMEQGMASVSGSLKKILGSGWTVSWCLNLHHISVASFRTPTALMGRSDSIGVNGHFLWCLCSVKLSSDAAVWSCAKHSNYPLVRRTVHSPVHFNSTCTFISCLAEDSYFVQIELLILHFTAPSEILRFEFVSQRTSINPVLISQQE